MAIIKSALSEIHLKVDPTSNAARILFYQSTGEKSSDKAEKTFSAGSIGAFTPPSSAQDLIVISGSPIRKVKVYSVVLSTTNINVSSQKYLLTKRYASGGGIIIPGIITPMDSSNDSPTIGVVGNYTTNPNIVGASMGDLNTVVTNTSNLVPGTAGSGATALTSCKDGVEFIPMIGGLYTPITLRGTDEWLVVQDALAIASGQQHQYRIVWTEQDY